MLSGEDGGRHQIQLDGDPESDRREACADDPPRIQNIQRRGSQFIWCSIVNITNSICHQGTLSGGRHARPAHRRHRREPEVHELPLRLQQDRSGICVLSFLYVLLIKFVHKKGWDVCSQVNNFNKKGKLRLGFRSPWRRWTGWRGSRTASSSAARWSSI